MKVTNVGELLKDKRVIEEIDKHLWLESQKAGKSIGKEQATEEWLSLHSVEWAKYHRPELVSSSKKKK